MKTNTMKTLQELRNLKWKRAVIVFDKSSWNTEYPLISRSYEISHDNKYFQTEMISNALYGNCLDGTDKGVRLDWYINKEWKVEYCYIVE